MTGTPIVRSSLPAARQWRFSVHALRRMEERRFSREEVLSALEAPITYYPGSPRYGTGRFIATRGRVAVVHLPDPGLVLTVLANGEAWPLAAAA